MGIHKLERRRKKPIKPTTQSQHKERIPLNCQSLTYWKRQNGYWFRSDFVISILIESTRLECCPSTKLKWNACISTLTRRKLNVYTHRRFKGHIVLWLLKNQQPKNSSFSSLTSLVIISLELHRCIGICFVQCTLHILFHLRNAFNKYMYFHLDISIAIS